MALPICIKLDFYKHFCKKLGLRTADKDDEKLIGVLLKMMEDVRGDFTMIFRELSEIDLLSFESEDISNQYWALKILSKHEWFHKWVKIYKRRVIDEGTDEESRQRLMQGTNPRYVLRNWMAQSAIGKVENDDFSEVQTLLKVLESPYTYQQEAEDRGYTSPPPGWAKSLKVSCSS